jgi:hypothetical protein
MGGIINTAGYLNLLQNNNKDYLKRVSIVRKFYNYVI